MSAFSVMYCLYLAIQVVIASFLLQPFILLLISGVGRYFGLRPQSVSAADPATKFQFGIIITAHRETEFIPPIIDSLLKQTYPHFNVYVVADECDQQQLQFSDPRIHILSPPHPLNNQLASLQFGFQKLSAEDEILVIFDPDNLVHRDFLKVLNAWYNKGYLAVQGKLQSKNTDGPYARIDGLGNTLSNFTDREMRSLLGLSSCVWGCGISVHRSVYNNITFDDKSNTGGFDKHMQADIAKNVPRIAYAQEALFYDEKVADAQNFERQRIRWIAAYFRFIPAALDVWATGLGKRSFNLMFFGYNLLRLPYFLLLLLGATFAVTDWLIDPRIGQAWVLILGLFSLSFLLILTRENTPASVLRSLCYIPLIFYHQLRALFRIKSAKTSMLKTEHHRVIYIDEILERGMIRFTKDHKAIVASGGSLPAPASNSENHPA
jgi:cellulose synthase/poly-beta-1,6-N-acetylglucosamine synthase-like glycosyltransferase